MGKNDLLKAAIVGMRHGHVGKPGEGNGYLETLRHLDGIEIVAYCEDTDLSLLDQAKHFHPNAGFYDNVNDLIDKQDFDIAWVVLPAVEVPNVGIKLANAGKHFYMEKQFARTSAEHGPCSSREEYTPA